MEYNKCMIFEKNTDAEATNRGFLYQYLITLNLWLTKYKTHNVNYELYCEFEDDLKLLYPTSKHVLYEQVKCYSKNFSLNSTEVKKSLFNYLMLYVKHSGKLNTQFKFTTNTGIAKTDKVLKRWVEKNKKFDNTYDLDLLSNIKSNLLSIIGEEAEKKIKSEKSKASKRKNQDKTELNLVTKEIEESKKYLNDLINDDKFLLSFVNTIEFNFLEVESIEIIDFERESVLKIIKSIDKIKEISTIVFSRLLSEIYFRSSKNESSERILTNDLLETILNETTEEMLSNTSSEFQELVGLLSKQSKKLDYSIELSEEIVMKMDVLLNSVNNNSSVKDSVEKYCLNYYDDEQIVDAELSDKKGQSNLVKKIKKIDLDDEDESLWINLATEIRCRYLLHLDELKYSNLIKEYKLLKQLEGKVKSLCLREVSLNKSKPSFSSEQFWKDFEKKLELEAKSYSISNNFAIDEEIVHAQMYQMAAECYLRWHRKGK